MVNYGMIGACILPNIGGWLGGLITATQVKAWYKNLNRPTWTPPDWVFGPVWTSLYTSMGYASYLVYKEGGGFNGDAKIPLILFGTQLALNWLWTPIFFGYHKLGLGFFELLLMHAAATATTVSFWPISKVASGIMVPYLAWLTLASALNYSIWVNNPIQDKRD